jgi:hypothetical protein
VTLRQSCFALLGVLLLAGTLLQPARAEASPATLMRGTGNLLAAPLDLVLAPVTGGIALAGQMREDGAAIPVRVVIAPIGWLWLTGTNALGGSFRLIGGGLETIGGVGVFFLSSDPEPALPVVERSPAMVVVLERGGNAPGRSGVGIGLNYAQCCD